MQLITNLTDIPTLDTPCGLTIGSFDGVHLGHQALLKHLKALLPHSATKVVFTFSTHPSHLFSPQSPVPLIYPAEQKAKLLHKAGADLVLMVPFTKAFSEMSPEEFLTLLKQKLNFSHLVLGVGSTFGKNRGGDEIHVRTLGEKLGFSTTYLEKLELGTGPISSGRIRTAIRAGNFKEASECLGRRYALLGKLVLEKDQFVLRLDGVCLPPSGVYSVHVKTKRAEYVAVADVNQQGLIRFDFAQECFIPADESVEVVF